MSRTHPIPPQRRRSGGRSAHVRRAVGRAVLDLLTEGVIAFTTVEVAERAGVSRRTIYRWWPTHADLLTEALGQHVRTVAIPETGSWERDLRAFAHDIAGFAAAPVDLGIARAIASGRQAALTATVFEHYSPVLAGWQQMFERALARGEVSDRHCAQTVINTLLAPLFLAPLMTGSAAPVDAVDRLVDLVLVATAPE